MELNAEFNRLHVEQLKSGIFLLVVSDLNNKPGLFPHGGEQFESRLFYRRSGPQTVKRMARVSE